MLINKEKNVQSIEQSQTHIKKSENKRVFVPAGIESTLISEPGKRKIPNTGGYSSETKVYSPASRGI